MKSTERFSIGDLAERFGLPAHVLRYWESMGLLEPARHPGGQRSYEQADLTRVALILMGKQAGFTLGELRAILSAPSPMDHRDLLHRHVQELERRITQAQAAKNLIEHALAHIASPNAGTPANRSPPGSPSLPPGRTAARRKAPIGIGTAIERKVRPHIWRAVRKHLDHLGEQLGTVAGPLLA
jgi:DNA-binding transcriptional MerR regulator